MMDFQLTIPHLLQRAETFFGDKDADRMCAELQALAGRAVLTTREASLLLSLVAHLQKSREKP